MTLLRSGLLMLIFAALCGCSSHSAGPPSPAQDKLNVVALLVESGSIDTIEIAYEPAIEHPGRLTADVLLKGSSYMLRVAGQGVTRQSNHLAEVLRSANAVPSSAWSGDVHWAIELRNRQGQEVIRIGLDENGRDGYVDSVAVRLQNNDILKWAQSMVPR